MADWATEPLADAEREVVRAQSAWEKMREKDPTAILIRLLIGVDESDLPLQHPFWSRIKTDMPSLELVLAQKIFQEIRMVKSEEEVRRMQEAVRITQDAWENALHQVREGRTERELAELFEHELISMGADLVTASACSNMGLMSLGFFASATSVAIQNLVSSPSMAKGHFISSQIFRYISSARQVSET